jgi:hypothetical protein
MQKSYNVSVDIRWTEEYRIIAKNARTAKRKAIERFRNKKSNFEADAELVE